MSSEHFIGRHPPRSAVDAVDDPRPTGRGAASAASAARVAPSKKVTVTGRQLYTTTLVLLGGLAFVLLTAGNFVGGFLCFGLLVLALKLSRIGD